MNPEQQARIHIDELLVSAGWSIQDMKGINLGASFGVAVREYPLVDGFADYLLFVDRKPLGVIEAKAEGVTLSGVAEQSEKYRTSRLRYLSNQTEPLRFAYESTGIETFFRDAVDIETKSRKVFAFHTPETLKYWSEDESSLRNRLKLLPTLSDAGLRQCILKDAFSGKLVLQDPNDEPAEKLLERIRAEREKINKRLTKRDLTNDNKKKFKK